MDPSEVPASLVPLLPLVEQWGLGDDADRDRAVLDASMADLEALVHSIDTISDDDLYGWLAGPSAHDPKPTREYVAFTNFTMAIDLARLTLTRRRKCDALVGHYEQHLGPIAGGWLGEVEPRKGRFQVVRFETSPIPGARVLATLGLSDHELRVGPSSRRLQQELVIMFREADGPRNLPGVLQQVAAEAIARDRALELGDVVGPRGPLVDGSKLEGFFVALPVYLPDSFHVLASGAGPSTVFGWLVPITPSEAEYVRLQGRAAFEQRLTGADPDLLDFGRAAIA